MSEASAGISIIGVGHQLASVVEDNETLCRRLEVTPDWIIEKTGICMIGPACIVRNRIATPQAQSSAATLMIRPSA